MSIFWGALQWSSNMSGSVQQGSNQREAPAFTFRDWSFQGWKTYQPWTHPDAPRQRLFRRRSGGFNRGLIPALKSRRPNVALSPPAGLCVNMDPRWVLPGNCDTLSAQWQMRTLRGVYGYSLHLSTTVADCAEICWDVRAPAVLPYAAT